MEIQQLLEGKFSLDINKIVFRKCTLEWEMRPNITNWDNLTYVYAGEIDYAVQGQLQHLQAGDLVYVPEGSLRWADTPEQNLAHLFSFDFKVIGRDGKQITLPLPFFSHPGIRQELVLLCRQCCNEWVRHLPGYQLKSKSYLMQLFHGILPRDITHLMPPVRDKRIVNMMAYILEHSDENIRLQDFARDLNLSPVYLGSLFKQVANETFHQYLMDCRLNRAEDLLETGQYTALEVMLLCGFNDFSYFSRAFKGRFGMPPGKYKRQDRKQPIPPPVEMDLAELLAGASEAMTLEQEMELARRAEEESAGQE